MEPGVKKILMRWKRREVWPGGIVGLDACITHKSSLPPTKYYAQWGRGIFFIIGSFRLCLGWRSVYENKGLLAHPAF